MAKEVLTRSQAIAARPTPTAGDTSVTINASFFDLSHNFRLQGGCGFFWRRSNSSNFSYMWFYGTSVTNPTYGEVHLGHVSAGTNSIDAVYAITNTTGWKHITIDVYATLATASFIDTSNNTVTMFDGVDMGPSTLIDGDYGVLGVIAACNDSNPSFDINAIMFEASLGPVGHVVIEGNATVTAAGTQLGTQLASVDVAATATVAADGFVPYSDYDLESWRWRDWTDHETDTPNWDAALNTEVYVPRNGVSKLRMLVQNNGPYDNGNALTTVKMRKNEGAWQTLTADPVTKEICSSEYTPHGQITVRSSSAPAFKVYGMRRSPDEKTGRFIYGAYDSVTTRIFYGDDGGTAASLFPISCYDGVSNNGNGVCVTHVPTAGNPYRYMVFINDTVVTGGPSYILFSDGYTVDSTTQTNIGNGGNWSWYRANTEAVVDNSGYVHLFGTTNYSDANAYVLEAVSTNTSGTAWPASPTIIDSKSSVYDWRDMRAFHDPTNDYIFLYLDRGGDPWYMHNKSGSFIAAAAMFFPSQYNISTTIPTNLRGGMTTGAAMDSSGNAYVFAISCSDKAYLAYDIRCHKFTYSTATQAHVGTIQLKADTIGNNVFSGSVGVIPGLAVRNVDDDRANGIIEIYVRYNQNMDSCVEQFVYFDTSTNTYHVGEHYMRDEGSNENWGINSVASLQSGRNIISYIAHNVTFSNNCKSYRRIASWGKNYTAAENDPTTQKLGIGTFVAGNYHLTRGPKMPGPRHNYKTDFFVPVDNGEEFEIEIPIHVSNKAQGGSKYEFGLFRETITVTENRHNVIADKEYIDANGTFPAGWTLNNGTPAPNTNAAVAASTWGTYWIIFDNVGQTGSWNGVDFDYTPPLDGYLWFSHGHDAADADHAMVFEIDGTPDATTTFSDNARVFWSQVGPLTGGTTYTISIKHTANDTSTTPTGYVYGMEFRRNTPDSKAVTPNGVYLYSNGYPTLYVDTEAAAIQGTATVVAVGTKIGGATVTGAVDMTAFATTTAVGTQVGAQTGQTAPFGLATVTATALTGQTETFQVAMAADATVAAAGVTFRTHQTDFRFRNDDGTETTATWKRPLNDDTAVVQPDTPFRLRVGVKNSGLAIETINGAALEYDVDGADSWQVVGAPEDDGVTDQQILPPQKTVTQLDVIPLSTGILSGSNAVFYEDDLGYWHVFFEGNETGFGFERMAYVRSTTSGSTWSTPIFWDGPHDGDANLTGKGISLFHIAADATGALVVWWRDASTITPPGITYIVYQMIRSTNNGASWTTTPYDVPNKSLAYTEMLFNSSNDYLFIGSRYGGTGINTYNLQVSVSTNQGSSWNSYSINAGNGNDNHHNMWVHGELDGSDNLLLWYHSGDYASSTTVSNFKLAEKTLAHPYTGGFPVEAGFDPDIVTIGGDTLPTFSGGSASQGMSTYMWTAPLEADANFRYCIYKYSNEYATLRYESGSWTYTTGETFEQKEYGTDSPSNADVTRSIYNADGSTTFALGDGVQTWGMPNGKLQVLHDAVLTFNKETPIASDDGVLRYAWPDTINDDIYIYEDDWSNVDEDTATTQQITSGTYYAANKGVTHYRNVVEYNQQLPAGNIVEYEYHLYLPAAEAISGRKYCFRVHGLDTYDRYACFTVVAPEVDMTAYATLTAVGTTDGPQTNISGVATLLATAFSPVYGQVTMNGVATVTPAGALILPSAPLALYGTATTDLWVEVEKLASTNLLCRATVETFSISSVPGAAALACAATVTAAEPTINVTVRVQCTGTGLLSPTASVTRSATVALFGECDIWRVRASVDTCPGIYVVDTPELAIVEPAPLQVIEVPGELSIIETEPELTITDKPPLHVGVVQQ